MRRQTNGGANDPTLTDGLLSAAKKSHDKAELEKAYVAVLRLDSNQLDGTTEGAAGLYTDRPEWRQERTSYLSPYRARALSRR